jgi:3-hydroxyisobutyrate dehydrogenase
MNTTKPRIGLVGAGRMGANMALHLHDLGYPITAIYDIHAPAAQKTAQETGAKAVTTLADVTAAADVIITVVSDDAAMYTIYAESGDSLLKGAQGKVFINSATVSPQTHIDVERLAEKNGASSIEASTASSIPQARSGTLYLMVAGRREVFDRVEPLLRDLSGSMRYIGPAGQAGRVKALVNMVMNINTAGLAEGLGLGDALGLDLTMLREVFSQTGANSRVLETDAEDMQNREHETYFSAAHAAKDSGIALNLAREQGLDLPLAAATKAQYDHLVDLGLGDQDKSAISELTFRSRHARQAERA